MSRAASLLGPVALAGAIAAWALVAISMAQPDSCAAQRAVAASREADNAQCRIDHGPDAIATQLPDGSHRCTDHNGRRLARSVITIPAHQLASVQP